jgi:hypothetical protein
MKNWHRFPLAAIVASMGVTLACGGKTGGGVPSDVSAACDDYFQTFVAGPCGVSGPLPPDEVAHLRGRLDTLCANALALPGTGLNRRPGVQRVRRLQDRQLPVHRRHYWRRLPDGHRRRSTLRRERYYDDVRQLCVVRGWHLHPRLSVVPLTAAASHRTAQRHRGVAKPASNTTSPTWRRTNGVRRRPIELEVIRSSGAAAFILTAGDVSGPDQAAIFVGAAARILRLAATHTRGSSVHARVAAGARRTSRSAMALMPASASGAADVGPCRTDVRFAERREQVQTRQARHEENSA